MILLAQSSSIGLGPAVLLAGCALATGALVGYGLGYRYKRKYLVAARQLSNLRGENFRGELTTIGMPRPAQGLPPRTKQSEPASVAHKGTATESETRDLLAASGPCESCAQLEAEKAVLVDQRQAFQSATDELTEQLARADRELSELAEARDAAMAEIATHQAMIETLTQQLAELPATTSDATQEWQLQQLHREQIQMQMQMDDYVEQIARLTAQLAAKRTG